ncbi:MAG TPA: alpha/beta fold hydrolase, partial [Dehalococcoidia bacterium]|nr:alpha/beta fold hydrolase [Dehalococcoidia bacterium]
MQQKAVSFPSGKLTLWGYLYYPDLKGPFPAVVLLHPHPLYGGSMSNNVIREVGSVLAEADMIALMFNFRGVGKSTGTFDEGRGEGEDAAAALDWLAQQPNVDAGKMGLCGYSFGGGITARVGCEDSRVSALAMIAPFFVVQHDLHCCRKPKFFITGEKDDVISREAISSAFRECPQPKEMKLYPQADHSWFGFEEAMARDVAGFFQKALR